MLRKLRGTKGQNTAEYAILFGIAVGILVAGQMYLRRAGLATQHDAVKYLMRETAGLVGQGETREEQFEPSYITKSAFDVTRTSNSDININPNEATANSDSKSERGAGGYQKFLYTPGGSTQEGMTPGTSPEIPD